MPIMVQSCGILLLSYQTLEKSLASLVKTIYQELEILMRYYNRQLTHKIDQRMLTQWDCNNPLASYKEYMHTCCYWTCQYKLAFVGGHFKINKNNQPDNNYFSSPHIIWKAILDTRCSRLHLVGLPLTFVMDVTIHWTGWLTVSMELRLCSIHQLLLVLSGIIIY